MPWSFFDKFGQRRESSAFASGPLNVVTALPASPSDGDEYVLTDSFSAPTYAWRMKWLAVASKWLFIGGFPKRVYIATDETRNSSNVWGDLATVGPSFTVPRAGDYDVHFGARQGPSGSADTLRIGASIGAADPAVNFPSKLVNGADQYAQSGRQLLTLTSGQEIRVRYFNGNAVAHWDQRYLYVLPIVLT